MHQPKAPDETGPRVLFYVALGLVTAATLMLQIIETRIISVTSWYHLAFFVISIAMFGLTAGAVWVYLRREASRPDELSYTGPAASLREVWVALRASMRSVLESVTLADVARGELPAEVLRLTAQPGVWEPH